MMTTYRPLFLAALAALLVGCPEFGSQEPPTADTIPENPTWTDVKPVLDRLCNECHSIPPDDGGLGVPPPATLRLDVCETVGGIPGAQSQAPRITVRTFDKVPTPMPPAAYPEQPTPDDNEILRRWVDQGATCDGDPANNQAPNNQAPNNQMQNSQTQNNQPNGDPNNQMQNNGNDMGMADMNPDPGMDVGVDMAPDMANDDPVWTFQMVIDYLVDNCAGCHADGGGSFDIAAGDDQATVAAELLTSGIAPPTDGMQFVVPGDPDNSALLFRLETDDDTEDMPPNGGANAADVMEIRRFIEDGADGVE